MSNKNDDLKSKSVDKNISSAVKNTFNLYTSEKILDTNPKDLEYKDRKSESIKALKSELQESIKDIQKTVSKEKVDKLLNRDKSQDVEMFKNDDSKMTPEHQKNIMKKLNKWESTQEINVANASVVASWLDRFGKLK